jgi:chromosome segregation ATPase
MPSIAQLEKRINELEAKRLLKVDEYLVLNAQVEKLKMRAFEIELLIKRQTEILRTKPEEVRQEIAVLEIKRDALEKETIQKKEQAEKTLAIYEARRGDLTKEIANLAKEQKTLQRLILDATQAVKAIDKDLKAIQAAQAQEQDKLSEIKEKYAPLFKDYQERIKSEEKKLSKLQKETGELAKLKPKLELFYRRIKRYYKQAGLEWFEIKDLE